MTRPSPPERPPADPKTEETLKSKAPPHWFIPAAEGLFCPLTGINCNLTSSPTTRPTRCFRPLAGMSCNICSLGYDQLAQMFPSPCGDKLHNTKLLYLFLQQKKRTFSGKKAVLRGAKRKARRAAKMPAAHKTRPAGQKVLRQGGFFWCCFGWFTGCAPG